MWERENAGRRELGDWSFELRDDEVADLRWRGRRVLRSVRAVVRDSNWDTAGWSVDGVQTDADAVDMRLHTDRLGADIAGGVRVTASGEAITVSFDAHSRTAFETNRTGLVVLHPPQVAGSPLLVEHPDGRVTATAFPAAISPHQPVLDIAGLRWADDGLALDAVFTGDVFEMEDQRNWTDASFKTYSRPLALPFPYRLAAGTRVAQSVTIAADATGLPAPTTTTTTLTLTAAGAFPSVSVGAATAPDPAPAAAAIGADLLVELDLASPAWPAALARAAASGLPLDVRLVISDTDPSASLAAAAAAIRRHRVARVAAFWPTGPARHVSDAAATALLRDALAGASVTAAVVGGVRSHFTELNREHRRLPSDLDGIVFAVTPLFHSVDTQQLIESLAMQRLVAAQAVHIAGGTPVHIGPVSLRPHFNDVATTPPPLPGSADLRAGYGPALLGAADERHSAPELAAWTVASAAALAVPGVATLSFFEEWGPRGIRSDTGEDLPVAAAIRSLVDLAGTTLLTASSPDGLVWAIGGTADDGSERVLVANAGGSGQTLRIVTPGGHAGVHLGAHTWISVATRRPD